MCTWVDVCLNLYVPWYKYLIINLKKDRVYCEKQNFWVNGGHELSYKKSKLNLVLPVFILSSIDVDLDLEDGVVGGGSPEVGIGGRGGGIGVANDDVGELGLHGDDRVEINDRTRETQNSLISMLVDLVFISDKLKK